MGFDPFQYPIPSNMLNLEMTPRAWVHPTILATPMVFLAAYFSLGKLATTTIKR